MRSCTSVLTVNHKMSNIEKACFALACFWTPDAQFGSNRGVIRTRVGYCGGTGPAPNYPSVKDHTEAIEVEYDNTIISFKDLLQLFWKYHDPCSCQKRQYMSVVFYVNDQQKVLAEESKELREKELGKPVATQILPLNLFHEAEDYHQKYFLRTYHRTFYNSLPVENPVTSTRDARLNGYLCGYGSLQELDAEKELLGLDDEQLNYVKRHITGEQQPAVVEPFLRTVVQVAYNYVKTAFS